VLLTANENGTFVGASTIDLDALILTITDKVFDGAAADNGIAGVTSGDGKGDTCAVVLGAFAVLTTIDKRRTFICTFTVYFDALILIVTDEMFDRTATEDGIAGVLSFAGKRDASRVVIIAFGVLLTTNENGTFICTFTVYFDALILIVTDEMFDRTATEDGIAGVLAGCRKSDTSGVVLGTLAMLTTIDKR
jgi:hypothetical protein